MIAALAGQLTQIDLKNIYVRNVRIIGSTLRSRTPEMKARILAELVEKVWPKVETGEVKPTIYKVLPIQEAEAAHDILYKGQNVGKVVLDVLQKNDGGIISEKVLLRGKNCEFSKAKNRHSFCKL
jgi:NADPH2:quinone reductase